jgi:hypothetical protein
MSSDNVTLLGRHPNDPAQDMLDMCECGDAPATVDCEERGWLCLECAERRTRNLRVRAIARAEGAMRQAALESAEENAR